MATSVVCAGTTSAAADWPRSALYQACNLATGRHPLQDVRIGIATGEVLAGSIGSEFMMSYTVMATP